ncbi:MAG: hypothetical protein AAGD05_12940, partial [Bacteroidota bacterium]
MFFEPGQHGNPIDMLRSDYVKAFAGAFVIFLVIALYALEMRHFSNTLEVKRLVLISFVVGFGIGGALAFRLRKYGDEPIEVFQICVIVILLTIAVMPLLLSMTNRLIVFQSIQNERAEFVESDAYIASRFGRLPDQEIEGYHTFVIHD